MTLFMDGGAQATKYREEAMAMIEQSPEFIATAQYDLSMPALRETTLRKVRRLYQIFLEHGSNVEKRNHIAELIGVYDLGLWVRNGVHFGLFMGAILSQGDKDQQDEWLVPLMTLQIFGCFSMTELGHGSFTRGLETTATFDPVTDEFVIHTPTDTATKWWIGYVVCLCVERYSLTDCSDPLETSCVLTVRRGRPRRTPCASRNSS
ncbi:hypothetical protein PINS_up020882 [Pythium insidiosum]|nr:hypothetical protein PINS_up020882 [Pythium insidiosum]